MFKMFNLRRVNFKSLSIVQLVLMAGFVMLSTKVMAAEEAAMWRYTVRPGDNLITLGKKHLINPDDWKTVQRLNNIKNPYRMHAGKSLRVPLELVKQKPAEAEVILVSGQAKLQKSAKDFVPLQTGQKLGPGARITTKEQSKVVIKFADGTTTELASNSTLQLDTMSLYSGGSMVDTTLRLQKGQLETHANPNHQKGNRIQVITPTAIAAVRGTKFRVTSEGEVTTQETLDGSVSLAAQGNDIAVDKGFGSKAEQGKSPIPPVVLLAAADTRGLKKQYHSLPITFDMPDMQGAAAWAGKVASDAELNQLIAEAETQSKQLSFTDVPDGDYYLSVRAKDENGIAGYDAQHQFTLNARPLQPVTVSPIVEGVVREPRPALQWNQVAEAQMYAVEIATDAAFENIYEAKQVTTTRHQIDKELTPGSYYWRVAGIAKNEQGVIDQGPAIKVSQFTYKALPPKPDVSQLTVNIARNRAMVSTVSPVEGMTYQASLDNEFNDQGEVWKGSGLGGQFDFLLREYGKQTLKIQHIDSDGTAGPAAIYEFNAKPQ